MSAPTTKFYIVTNSYKGGLFMSKRRNVRRSWDMDDHRPPKKLRLDNTDAPSQSRDNEENTTILVDEDNLERAIRETSVAALSSSPSRKNSTVFSLESHDDDGSKTITPPSSPPPQLQITPPKVKARKPTFSILEKQKKEKMRQQSLKRKADTLREEPEPLSEIFNSSRALPASFEPSFTIVNNTYSRDPGNTIRTVTPPAEPEMTRPQPLKQQSFVQSVLDFGQSLQPTTCATCSMTYTPTIPEDNTLHNMYHNRHSAGIDLGKLFLKSAMKWCYEVPNIPGSVVVVDRKISLPGRKVVQRVLEVVNKELGSVDIEEEELWSQRALPGDDEARKCDRYKAFLQVMDGKCIGICLAERVNRAYKVLPESDEGADVMPLNPAAKSRDVEMMDNDTTPRANQVSGSLAEDLNKPMPTSMPSPPMSSAPSSSIAIAQTPHKAIVGVSRIWTSRAFRRKGIANNLLECVMNQFVYGMDIDQTDVAFSQPTESGVALARAWFGEDSGWNVYTED